MVSCSIERNDKKKQRSNVAFKNSNDGETINNPCFVSGKLKLTAILRLADFFQSTKIISTRSGHTTRAWIFGVSSISLNKQFNQQIIHAPVFRFVSLGGENLEMSFRVSKIKLSSSHVPDFHAQLKRWILQKRVEIKRIARYGTSKA